MKHLLYLLLITIFFSCEPPENHAPIKTIPYTCDNNYYAKIKYTDYKLDIIIPSIDNNGFYSINEKGIFKYSIDSIKIECEHLFNLGKLLRYFYVCSNKKIWIQSQNSDGNFVHLIDTTGKFILTKRVSSNGIISANNSDGFILTFNSIDSSNGNNNFSIESYDKVGELLWSRCYNIRKGEIKSIFCLSNNNILVGGYIDSTINVGGYRTPYLAKLDNLGIMKWEKTYSLKQIFGYGFSIEAISEKLNSYNLIIAGNSKFHVLEIDSVGNTIWDKDLMGYFNRNEHFIYVQNKYYILYQDNGIKVSDIKLTCLNDIGDIQWSQSFGGEGREYPLSINILPLLDIFVTGTTENWDGKTFRSDNYLIKADNKGNICY